MVVIACTVKGKDYQLGAMSFTGSQQGRSYFGFSSASLVSKTLKGSEEMLIFKDLHYFI